MKTLLLTTVLITLMPQITHAQLLDDLLPKTKDI
tara:strand:- start:104 stop:205 length:102 start_codon:yes stop_codon:yes gene_type:complete